MAKRSGLRAFRFIAVVFVAGLLVAEALSSRADAKEIGSVGGWRLFYNDANDNPVCGMSAAYKNGTELYLRVSSRDLSSSVSLYDRRWRSIRNRQQYQLFAQFSGQRRPSFSTSNALGENENSEVALHFVVDGDFLKNFRRKYTVGFFLRDGRELVSLSLKDTARAMNGSASPAE